MAKKCLFSMIMLLLTSSVGAQQIDLPTRGTLKSNVEAKHGRPDRTLGPVGNPPITQWVYDQFTVVFEYEHVVHAYLRDRTIENRPQTDIPARPDLTLPHSATTAESNSEAVSPNPVMIDDRNEINTEAASETAVTTDETADDNTEFDAIFDSDESESNKSETTSDDFSDDSDVIFTDSEQSDY